MEGQLLMNVHWYIFGCNSIATQDWTIVDIQNTEEEAINSLKDCVEYQYWKIEKIWSYPF